MNNAPQDQPTPAASAASVEEPALSVEEALTIASRLMQDMAISMIAHQTAEARKAADSTTSTRMGMQKSRLVSDHETGI